MRAAMDFQIERGFFTAGILDCHAILGVPVQAEISKIQHQYRKVARRLHPDVLLGSGTKEQLQGSQLFSKWVSPAYRILSSAGERTEYALLLKLKAQQFLKQTPGRVDSSVAKQLLDASDLEMIYTKLLQQLIVQQYDNLEQAIQITGDMSELNLVYLARKENKSWFPGQTSPPAANSTLAPPTPSSESPAAQYWRRAEALITNGDFTPAIFDLREGLKLDPSAGRCHALLGEIYLQQNQLTMARIHLNQALKINPKDIDALNSKRRLEKIGEASQDGGRSPRHSNPIAPKQRGLFGWLPRRQE